MANLSHRGELGLYISDIVCMALQLGKLFRTDDWHFGECSEPDDEMK
jgi:hypothetical protein